MIAPLSYRIVILSRTFSYATFSMPLPKGTWPRSEEHTSELQSLMRISYAVFCLKKKRTIRSIEKAWLCPIRLPPVYKRVFVERVAIEQANICTQHTN